MAIKKPKMGATEWRQGLRKCKLGATQACRLIYLETGAVIDPDAVYRAFKVSNGRLPSNSTALWRYFFTIKEIKEDARA